MLLLLTSQILIAQSAGDTDT